MKLLVFLLLAFVGHSLFSQDIHGVKMPDTRLSKKCAKCVSMLKTKSNDIQIGIQRVGEELFFLINDEPWFNQLFEGKNDGLMIDIVNKDQFSCNSRKTFKNSNLSRGFVLEPTYKKDFGETIFKTPDGVIGIKVGEIPLNLQNEELEFNIIFIQDKHYCFYHWFFQIPGHKWQLLEMGLYSDSLFEESNIEKAITRNKRFKFEILFEKNKYDYQLEDIQPIYDSLNLFKYDIKSIEIDAYSSVEGDRTNNEFLQRKRAESIVQVLEDFQNHPIEAKINTSENWVDFFNDIKTTNYKTWATSNKSTIKKKLSDEKIVKRLENILLNHRKAILYLELEKRFTVSYQDKSEIIKLFDQALDRHDLEEAKQIQSYVYQSIKNEKLPTDFLNKLEIPKSSEFGILHNNKIVYNYRLAPQHIYSTLAEFRKLNSLIPNNLKVLYNILVLSIKAWSYGDPLIQRENLLVDIQQLEKKGLHQSLVTRLKINYNILLSEELQQKRFYKAKDELVRKTYSIYRQMSLSETDALSLAKYFVSYQKYNWARALLKPYINDIKTSEDVLFYYINLTIIDPKMVGSTEYRTLLLNASNKNIERFCALFKPLLEGGVTFQLLNNLFLRQEYCDNCFN